MAIPGSFTVTFQITVSGVGQRTVPVAVASATDAEDAIRQAKQNLVQVLVIAVAQP